MSTNAAPRARMQTAPGPRVRLGWLASVAFCGVLPAAILAVVFASSIGDGSAAIDFRPFYRAAEALLAGETPYPAADALLTASGQPYVYPPLSALLSIPLTVLPLAVAEVLVMVVQVLLVLAIPYLLGVRDWRCYGILLLWPPVISAIQTGNVTLWLGVACALAWRWRDRAVPSAACLGATFAIKFFLWPLLVWLVASRRIATAALALAVGLVLLIASWATIGFDGLRGYPELLRRLEDAVGDDAYTVFNLASDLGAPDAIARALWLGLGFALLAACVVLARKGDERSSFVLVLAAALALTPLVWLHYFALLAVACSIARPRLGVVWFVPLAMFVATGVGDPTPLQTVVTLTAGGVTVALAVRDSRRLGAVT